MKERSLAIIICFVAAGALFTGKFYNSEVPVFIDQPAPAPAMLSHVSHDWPQIPTNNWVKEVELTPKEALDRSSDIAELRRLAQEKKERGERVEKIVLSKPDLAWITYIKSQKIPARKIGLVREDGRWR